MAAFTEDQVADFQETFNLFDNRGDGRIYARHVGEFLRSIGLNPTEADVKRCVPKDPDVRISFEQSLPYITSLNKNRDTSAHEDFVEGFKVFDKEQNGFMSSAELRHLLTSLGERLSDEEVNELVQGMEDTHGNINYEEFVRMVLSA